MAKPIAHVSAAGGEDRGIDPDKLSVGVYQRAARVPGVDGGIGLDEVLKIGNPHVGTAHGAHDPHGNGLVQAEGVADSQNDVSDLQFAGLAEFDRRQVPGIDLDDGEVRPRVGADDLAGELPFVVEDHLDLISALDDVVVRQNISLLGHDHAGTQGRGLVFSVFLSRLVELIAEKAPEERVVEHVAEGIFLHRDHRGR